MKQNVLIYTNVGKAQITDTDSHFKITGIPITKNDSVMNRVLYPADENQRGMPTMKEKPITLRHPEVDGVNVSATQGRGLNYFSGSLVESEPYIENNTWKIDALINKKKLAAQDDGERWTEILSNKELFGVSTGLTFERNSDSGDGYDMIARNQQYDHLAFLDPKVEKPAGGDDTMVRFNSSVEAGEIIVHNIEQDDDPQINQEHKGLFNKFLSWLGSHGEFADVNQTGYNNDDTKTNGDRKMRNLIEAKLTAAGIEVNGLDDGELLEALNEYTSKSKETEMDDEDKEKMSKSNGEEMAQLIEQIVNKAIDPLKAQINASAEAELNQVAEQVAALNMGLDADDAKALGLDRAKAFLAANSKTSAAGFPGAMRSSAANAEEQIDVDLNAGID